MAKTIREILEYRFNIKGMAPQKEIDYVIDQALTSISQLVLKQVGDIIHNDITPELVEKHFPKGQSAERGQAIVLHAEMLITLDAEIRTRLKDIMK